MCKAEAIRVESAEVVDGQRRRASVVGPVVGWWQLDTTGPQLGRAWPQVIRHVRGTVADKHTCECIRIRGGGAGGGDVATFLCTIL